MPGHEVTWNGVSSTSIPQLVVGPITRSLVGAFRGSLVDVAGREGAWHFPETPGLRIIKAECFVEASSFAARRDAVTAVADWLDLRTSAKLILSDDPTVYYDAAFTGSPDTEEWREFGIFELEWSAQPYSLDLNTSLESFTADASESHTWDPGLSVYTYPVITVTPNNGTLDGFSLLVNGNELIVDDLVPDDTTVVINSISAIVTTGANTDTEITGAYNTANVFMAGVSGVFPTLITGSNTILFTRLAGTATNISVLINYRKRYRK